MEGHPSSIQFVITIYTQFIRKVFLRITLQVA